MMMTKTISVVSFLYFASLQYGVSAEGQALRGLRMLQAATAVPTFAPTTNVSILTTELSTDPATEIQTPAPTTNPTAAPTARATTKAPTGAPTDSPTPNPTTPSPTRVPTPAPTRAPITPDETYAPTVSPTPVPTRAPVVATARPTEVNEPDSSNGNSGGSDKNDDLMRIVIIAVASGAGTIMICIMVFFFFKGCKAVSKKDASSTGRQPSSNSGNKSFGRKTANTSDSGKSPELYIPTSYNCDISTLGDPAGLEGNHKNMFEDDNMSLTTEAFNRVLDAKTTYQRGGPALEDPGECFDVRLPAGRVGVILEDDAEFGMPVVNGVKNGSPLEGRIKNGDRLLSVDGIDCTGKTPHDVAHLLQQNEQSSTRILTFSRPTRRNVESATLGQV